MRDIKFRAWHKSLKLMIESDRLESINFEVKTLGIYAPIENKGFHKFRTSDFELMQFTGLYDDLDNEIYEGDIIRIHNGEYEVKWDKYQFILVDFYSSSNDTPCDYFYERSGETVIGNIYENAELLDVMDS